MAALAWRWVVEKVEDLKRAGGVEVRRVGVRAERLV
jgi:hypothetical protein